MIKVVRGNPTPEELAAALAVVRARARRRPPPRPPGRRCRPSSGRTRAASHAGGHGVRGRGPGHVRTGRPDPEEGPRGA
ncbi:acyl-CoA carboxylase epsilon subunit [Streptomyces flavovirens]|uniref:acyl-CoA carboxylase epsilon subunit n=1 Tax=Streptomyces flavovirens TaxID=52258 RepID=UPI0031EC835B